MVKDSLDGKDNRHRNLSQNAVVIVVEGSLEYMNCANYRPRGLVHPTKETSPSLWSLASIIHRR
jgi:hypothetical protein